MKIRVFDKEFFEKNKNTLTVIIVCGIFGIISAVIVRDLWGIFHQIHLWELDELFLIFYSGMVIFPSFFFVLYGRNLLFDIFFSFIYFVLIGFISTKIVMCFKIKKFYPFSFLFFLLMNIIISFILFMVVII